MATLPLIFIFYYHHQSMFNVFPHGAAGPLPKLKSGKVDHLVRVKETWKELENRRETSGIKKHFFNS